MTHKKLDKAMDLEIKIDIAKKAKRSSNGLSLFSLVRNESYFLPFFFAHYRSLGVENFLVYDDNSDDGSSDYLAAQPDCTVIRSDKEYGDKFSPERRLIHVLKSQVPDSFFPKRWVVTPDADEFMLLPSPFQTLTELTTELDQRSILCVTAPMVDFYPERLSQRNHGCDIDPFVASNFFDGESLYERERGATKRRSGFRGIRARLARMLYMRDRQRFLSIFGSEKASINLSKVPIIKRGFGVLPVGSHRVNISPQRHIGVALAHFKFCPNLDVKLQEALRRQQYHDASVEYRFLQAVLELFDDTSLLSPQTRQFLSPKSLEEAGYMTPCERGQARMNSGN